MSYSVSGESSSSSSSFWSIISGSGDNTQHIKRYAKVIRNSSILSTKAHRRSKKSHKPKLKKEASSLKAMAAKLTEFTKITDVTSWNSLNLFARVVNNFNCEDEDEEDFGMEAVEMDEDISLRTTYDFNRV
jgi:hypothetical protein